MFGRYPWRLLIKLELMTFLKPGLLLPSRARFVYDIVFDIIDYENHKSSNNVVEFF